MKEKLQLKLQQKRALFFKQQYDEAMKSTDIDKIQKLMLNIIDRNEAKITGNDSIVKSCFFKYLIMLKPIALNWTIMDIKIINTFIDESDNTAVNKAEILRCFACYEILPPSSQKQELKNMIKAGYKALYFEQASTLMQNQQESLLLFREAIQKKSFILAKALYEELGNKVMSQDDFRLTSLSNSVTAKFNQQDFVKVIELLDIKLQTLRGKTSLDSTNTVVTITATPLIIPYIQEIWSIDNNKAKSLLDYFIGQALPFQAKESYNHALIIAMGCKNVNLDFIKALLEANIVDVNTIITPVDDYSCKVVKTPFSVAVGKVNFDLLSLLLEHGADPSLATKIALLNSKTQYGDETKIFVSSGLAQKLKSPEEIQKYLIRLDEFTENFFLTKLAKIHFASAQEAAEQPNSSSSSSSSSANEEIQLTQATSQAQATTVLDQYLNYKEVAQNNSELPERKILEHKFDSLLLKWLKINDPSLLESLSTLLAENPELHSYSITYLLNQNISHASASEVYADKPKLLHKFCSLKKKLNNNIKTDTESLILQKNVYEVKGKFSNKIFVKISDKTLEELNVFDVGYKNKLLSQLHTLKFIKTDSHNVSGIKNYSGCIKLKIAGFDKNLYTTQRYMDKDNNILMVFDKLGNHSNTPYNEGITTIDSDFKEAIYERDIVVANISHSDDAYIQTNFADLISLGDGVGAQEIPDVQSLGESQ